MLSQQSLLNIFQELPIPIVILFPDFPHFTISETNKSFNETFNIDKDHIIGNKISNYFYTDQNKNNLLKSLKTTADQNIITEVFEFKFDVKGRQTLFFNIKCVPSLSNEGDLQNIVCYFSNIYNSNISQLSDKIKPIENNSLDKDKSSEEWYKMLFTLSHLPKWVYDLKTLKILDVNESAIKKYGYTREEFLSLNVKELIPDSEIPEFLKLLKTLEDNTGTINNGILLNKRKDKTTIKVNVLRNKFINNGRSCILVESVDVTEREEALQLLKDNESKYISAQKIAKLGYWELNLKTLELYWSDGVYNIFEVDKKSFKVSLESFYNTIHPEDIKEMRKVNTEAIKGEKELDIKHRIILPDGSVKWVREKAKITKDNNGDFNILEGTVQDINAEKKLELSLEETKSLYEYATKATSDLIWDWDLKTDILFWGDDFKKIFGENFINNLNVSITWIERIHPEDAERILKSVQNSIEGSDLNWSGEYRILKGDQTYIHVLDKGFFLRDSTGKAYRMVGAMQDISERKALETLLEKSNRLAKIGSWEIDVLTDTVYWSDITKEIREADPDFVPHLSLGIEYFKEGKNRETISSRVQNCIKNFTPWDEELQIVTQKGNLKWIRTIGEPEILNGKCVKVFGSFQDIDEKKQSAEKIRLSNERFERVSEASRDAIWDIDLITNTIFLGNGFKNLWGENYINKIYGRENWMNNFYKEDRPRVEKIMNESLENKETSSFAIEFNYIKESGALVPVSAHASIIRNEHGVPIRMVGSFLDITIQKEYEKSLQKLNENLAQSNKLLTISNNELEQFAYVTSHDLQEPLRMVTAFLSQLERKYSNVIDEKGKKYIYFAIDGAMRMRQIILDLLEYSKVGRSQESLKTINLNYLINEITPLYKKKIEETNASIFFEKLPIIKSFKTPLRQILHNLISNSLKYQGTENPIIKITVDELNEFWKISVKDNGIGIKEEFFDRIFIPFQRLHNKEKYSGTGIGLSIVKKTVETLGGEIWVESKEGVGSSFIFTIKKAT